MTLALAGPRNSRWTGVSWANQHFADLNVGARGGEQKVGAYRGDLIEVAAGGAALLDLSCQPRSDGKCQSLSARDSLNSIRPFVGSRTDRSDLSLAGPRARSSQRRATREPCRPTPRGRP